MKKTGLFRFPMKAGEKVSAPVGLHWTTNLEIAADFANGPGQFGLLLEAVVDPEDVVLDYDALPKRERDLLEWGNEGEVYLCAAPALCVVYGHRAPRDLKE